MSVRAPPAPACPFTISYFVEGQVGKRAFQSLELILGSPTPNHVGHPITDDSGKCEDKCFKTIVI